MISFLQVELEEYELIIHGTKEKPCDYERFIKNDEMTVSFLNNYERFQYIKNTANQITNSNLNNLILILTLLLFYIFFIVF